MKKTFKKKVRKYTIIGVILLGITGYYCNNVEISPEQYTNIRDNYLSEDGSPELKRAILNVIKDGKIFIAEYNGLSMLDKFKEYKKSNNAKQKLIKIIENHSI